MRCIVVVWLMFFTAEAFCADFKKFDNVLYISGEIYEGDFEKFSKSISEGNVSFAILNSVGGNALEAMRIASVMSDMKLNTVVSDICASSCANYLFLAGNKKIIMQHGVVIWHGSYSQECGHTIAKSDFVNKSKDEIENFLDGLKVQHAENEKFFKKIKVKAGITCLNMASKKEVDERYPESTGFTLTADAMKVFGVDNILDFRDRYVESGMSKHVAIVDVEILRKSGFLQN
jgi:hypothetical protein